MLRRRLGLIIPLLLVCTSSVFAAKFGRVPEARDDFGALILGVNSTYEATGDGVLGNDSFGDFIQFDKITGKYGFLSTVNSAGTYTYTAYEGVFLAPGETAEDIFPYTLINTATGQTSKANIIIRVSVEPETAGPIVINDQFSIFQNTTGTVSGDVRTNDQNGTFVQLTDPTSLVGEYGFLALDSTGTFVYTLNEDSPNVVALKVGDVKSEVFSYDLIDSVTSKKATGTLTIQVVGRPVDVDGNIVFQAPEGDPLDNVDIEFNDRSADATPLNSGRNIKGHLYDSLDKDWYSLASAGNEVISFEVCPQGSTCFEKGSWVLYIFDSAKLTTAMEEQLFVFTRRINTTGTTADKNGVVLIPNGGIIGASNHLYLAYRSGFFDGALVGIVDPCFDSTNSVDIGVGFGARDYLVAISSPLLGEDGVCGKGEIIQEKAGNPVISTTDNNGNITTESLATTEQFITSFPFSDDQYLIKVTGTGIDPLSTDNAAAKSATFDEQTGTLSLPRVRVTDGVYQATLNQQQPNLNARSSDGAVKFILSEVETLSVEQVVDVYRATYNPENQQVMIPRVTILGTDKAYSVILQYYPAVDGGEAWFEVTKIQEI